MQQASIGSAISARRLERSRQRASGLPPPPQQQPSSQKEEGLHPEKLTVEELLHADEASAAAAAAEPLPFSWSTWEKNGGVELEPLLAYVTLIDAAWLLELALGEVMPGRKGVVPAWQDVPPEAKVSLAQLRHTTMSFILPVLVLSYGWADRGHPDPTGEQLQRLVPVLRTMARCCEEGTGPNFKDDRPRVWGVLWDFMSFPQRGYTTGYVDDERDAAGKVVRSHDDRTQYEQERFGKGLACINWWYSAPRTTTLIVDLPIPKGSKNAAPVDQRGWCVFERGVSSITKYARCCLTLSSLPEGQREAVASWEDLTKVCMASRNAPLAPDAFAQLMRDGLAQEAAVPGTGLRFTNGKDATKVCIPQYEEAFVRLMSTAETLTFAMCGWGDKEAEVLAGAIVWLHANETITPVWRLRLCANQLTVAALVHIVDALAVGAMPNLISLDLNDNRISDAGAQFLAEAFTSGSLPKLLDLELAGNQVGDAGAEALAAVVRSSGTPEKLVIGRNTFGEAAAATLRAACQARGVLANYDWSSPL